VYKRPGRVEKTDGGIIIPITLRKEPQESEIVSSVEEDTLSSRSPADVKACDGNPP